MAPQESFTLKNEPVENLRPLKVRVIGAGYSGIVAAIRIPQRLRNVDLVVYEKNDGIGGVWWLNRYPGVACDIPSHSYQYSFAPNPHWSSLYAPGKEIQAYLQDVADKFGATRFIKTLHELQSATWDSHKKQWHLVVLNVQTGEMLEEDCHVLITARGQLNNVNWPDLPGLETFRGKIVHSGAWDENCDFRNKRVAVIGNGSSSIQIVPKLQKVDGTDLKVFMRSRTWITSKFGDQAMIQLGLNPDDDEIAEDQREAWANDTEAYLHMRKVIENDGNSIHDSSILGSDMQRTFRDTFRDGMQKTLEPRPDLFDLIVPDFAPGCRRLTPGRGYLKSLMAPNVEVIPAAVTAATETGVVAAGGDRHLDVDVIVCATGFKVSEPPPFPITGRNGRTLTQRWAEAEGPDSYLSLAVDGFPNFFMMFGPNSAIGFGSLTMILEAECDYVVQVLRKLQREDYATMEPRPERVADFREYVDAYFRNTVYMDNCRSWYRTQGGTGNRICGLWPGSTLHALEVLRSPRWEDFVYEVVDEVHENGVSNGANGNGVNGKVGKISKISKANAVPNRLRWLGNGRSVIQTPGGGDMSWYLNPDQVDVPWEGQPEDDPRYQARPWSY